MPTCGIYKITSPSGKIYIGQSIHIEKRLLAYKNMHAKKQTRLHRSLLKYGFEAHQTQIVHVCTERELDSWERYFIDVFNTYNTQHGLNLQAGGEGGKHSPESIEKMRIAALRKPPVSLESRERMRKGQIGNKNALGNKAWTGRKHSEETIKLLKEKRKLQVFKKGYSRTFTQEWKDKLAVNLRALAVKKCRTIYSKDSSGKVIKHTSIKECALHLNIHRGTVLYAVHKGSLCKGKYYFSFKPFPNAN